MHLLPALPVILLAAVTAWLVWPLFADPIARRFVAPDSENGETGADEDFRSWADRARHDSPLLQIERG